MTRRTARWAFVAFLSGATLLAPGCREDLAAPGACPQFCPSTPIGLVDTILRAAVVRDSTYGRPVGYVAPESSTVLIAATLPSVDSRPILRFAGIAGDSAVGPLLQPDSVYLRILLLTRDTSAHNVRLAFYALPLAVDSTTTFADLAGPFAAAPLRSLNVDSLLAFPADTDSVAGARLFARRDPVTGDAAVEDSVGDLRRFTLYVKFDSTQIPYVEADSGRVALGVRVSADHPTSAALASVRAGAGAALIWFSKMDSLGTPVFRAAQAAAVAFDNFVFDPPPPALDTNLAVGGLPATRSVLRFDLPTGLVDSTQVVRATLVLVPAIAAQGAARDSFRLFVHQVSADFGAKSPLAVSVAPDSATVRIGAADTVNVEITAIVRLWQSDSLVPRAVVLRQLNLVPVAVQREGTSFAEIRFYSSRAAAYRPALHVTYVPRYTFGPP